MWENKNPKGIKMKVIGLLAIGCTAGLFMGCANFPNKYENIVEDEKIRPIAIVLDPPEAAPGDTVQVKLHYYDAGRADIRIQWQIALDYSVDNYGGVGSEREIRNLDSMALPGGDSASFSFVVPTGDQNPLLLASMLPDSLPGAGSRDDLIRLLETMPMDSLPAEYAPLVDQFLAVTVLRAKIQSDMEIDITKRLTVRYSKKMSGAASANVNENPRLDRFGIIGVDHRNLTDPDSIGFFRSDTQFFMTNGATVDTFSVDDNHTYFLWADTAGAAQAYQSPSSRGYPQGREHVEDLYYDWFYTNLDESAEPWDQLIRIGEETGPKNLSVVRLRVPNDRDMHNFIIRVAARDYRPEWAVLAAQGVAYAEARGYFEYR